MRGMADHSGNCLTELITDCLKMFIRKNLSNLSKLKIVEAIDKIFLPFRLRLCRPGARLRSSGRKLEI